MSTDVGKDQICPRYGGSANYWTSELSGPDEIRATGEVNHPGLRTGSGGLKCAELRRSRIFSGKIRKTCCGITRLLKTEEHFPASAGQSSL